MEEYKKPEEIMTPDTRWSYFGRTLEGHWQGVNKFILKDFVPDPIKSEFNTAKNLLLYTWYAYDLIPAAELKIFSAMEVALRKKLGDKVISELKKNEKGLYGMIKFTIDHGMVCNQDFLAWHKIPYQKARDELLMNKLEEMHAAGKDEIEIDYGEMNIPETNTEDFMPVLRKRIHKVRNMYAHGETLLDPNLTWESFEICTDFINALFLENNEGNE